MIKYYCDQCGKELSPDEEKRVMRKLRRVSIGGNICDACIVEAVVSGERLKK